MHYSIAWFDRANKNLKTITNLRLHMIHVGHDDRNQVSWK